VQVSIAWLKDRPEAYQALYKLWASEEFIAKSIKSRERRGKGGIGHTYGPDGHIRMCKWMVKKLNTQIHS
jgi:hypothetical protein